MQPTGSQSVDAQPGVRPMADPVEDDSIYYGELAFHFNSGAPLLIPVAAADGIQAVVEYMESDPFVVVQSRDNRIVAIRSEAVVDLYLVRKTFDTRGPEPDRYQPIGPIDLDHEFWSVMQLVFSGVPDACRDHFTIEQVARAENTLEKLRDEHPDTRWDEVVRARARHVVWQHSNGLLRSEAPMPRTGHDDVEAYEDIVAWFAMSAGERQAIGPKLMWTTNAGERGIVVNLASIDYLSAPFHLMPNLPDAAGAERPHISLRRPSNV